MDSAGTPHRGMLAEKLHQLIPGSARYYTFDSIVRFYEWKFDKAIEEVKQAIKLAPKLTRAHGLYGFYLLMARGDAEAALREYRVAEQLDLSDVTIQTILAGPVYAERDFSGTIQQSQKAVQSEPRAPIPHRYLARAYESEAQHDQSKYDQALNQYEQYALLCDTDPEKTHAWHEKLRAVLKEKGARGLWQFLLDEHRRNPWPDSYITARIYARLGDADNVFSCLDLAFKEHNGNMTYLVDDDAWDPFRRDPRFQDLLRKMGFRPKSPSFH